MNYFMRALSTITLLCPFLLCAQITTTDWPEGRYSFTSLGQNSFISRVKLPHNSTKAILDEVFDDAFVRSIGKTVGLTDEHLAKVRIFKDPEKEEEDDLVFILNFFWLDDTVKPLREALDQYITARYEGRTKESMQAALTNLTPVAEIKDSGIRGIVEKYPLIPASWLRKEKSGDDKSTVTKGGKTYKLKGWAVYYLVDEDIAWRYYVNFKAEDGTVFSVYASRLDAKEYNEKYAEVFKLVAAEVEREMKKEGITGLGSIHSFWHLKKEKLKKKGILWRSPSELNPGTNYD